MKIESFRQNWTRRKNEQTEIVTPWAPDGAKNMMDINGYISCKNLKVLLVILGQFPIMLEKKIQEIDPAPLQVQPRMTRMGKAMFPLSKWGCCLNNQTWFLVQE